MRRLKTFCLNSSNHRAHLQGCKGRCKGGNCLPLQANALKTKALQGVQGVQGYFRGPTYIRIRRLLSWAMPSGGERRLYYFLLTLKTPLHPLHPLQPRLNALENKGSLPARVEARKTLFALASLAGGKMQRTATRASRIYRRQPSLRQNVQIAGATAVSGRFGRDTSWAHFSDTGARHA